MVEKKINSEIDLEAEIKSKDAEIEKLRAEAKSFKSKVNVPVEDIRNRKNKAGDYALICIGINQFGRRKFKPANTLTEKDIEARNEYLGNFKPDNQKKN